MIVGGNATGINEYPMMAGLVDAQQKEVYCGATIIDKQYVMTAAHCIIGRNYNLIGVLVGDHDLLKGKLSSNIYQVNNFLRRGFQASVYTIAVSKLSSQVVQLYLTSDDGYARENCYSKSRISCQFI